MEIFHFFLMLNAKLSFPFITSTEDQCKKNMLDKKFAHLS